MPRLRLLHLQSPLAPDPHLAQVLAEDLPPLRLLGLGDNFWRIDRTESEPLVSEVSQSRLMMELTDDFAAEDENWLLMWHNEIDDMT
jgi:hypothetical protein